jgi:hypothetical protein
MVNQGTETQQKTVFITTYHSSFMVCTGGCWFTVAEILLELDSQGQRPIMKSSKDVKELYV